MSEDEERVLEACRRICTQLASEAVMRIDSDLKNRDHTDSHRGWLQQQRETLTEALNDLS